MTTPPPRALFRFDPVDRNCGYTNGRRAVVVLLVPIIVSSLVVVRFDRNDGDDAAIEALLTAIDAARPHDAVMEAADILAFVRVVVVVRVVVDVVVVVIRTCSFCSALWCWKRLICDGRGIKWRGLP